MNIIGNVSTKTEAKDLVYIAKVAVVGKLARDLGRKARHGRV